jgi:hypothetical protein
MYMYVCMYVKSAPAVQSISQFLAVRKLQINVCMHVSIVKRPISLGMETANKCMYVGVCMQMCIHACMQMLYVCMSAYTQTHAYMLCMTHSRGCLEARAAVASQYLRAYIYIYIYTHTRTHTYVHTLKHKHVCFE